MKKVSQRVAAMALLVALSVPTVALAAPIERERGRDRDVIIRILYKIQKFFGFTPNDDLPTPPHP